MPSAALDAAGRFCRGLYARFGEALESDEPVSGADVVDYLAGNLELLRSGAGAAKEGPASEFCRGLYARFGEALESDEPISGADVVDYLAGRLELLRPATVNPKGRPFKVLDAVELEIGTGTVYGRVAGARRVQNRWLVRVKYRDSQGLQETERWADTIRKVEAPWEPSVADAVIVLKDKTDTVGRPGRVSAKNRLAGRWVYQVELEPGVETSSRYVVYAYLDYLRPAPSSNPHHESAGPRYVAGIRPENRTQDHLAYLGHVSAFSGKRVKTSTKKKPDASLTKTEQKVFDRIPPDGLNLGFVSRPLLYSDAIRYWTKPERRALYGMLDRQTLVLLRMRDEQGERDVIFRIGNSPDFSGVAVGFATDNPKLTLKRGAETLEARFQVGEFVQVQRGPRGLWIPGFVLEVRRAPGEAASYLVQYPSRGGASRRVWIPEWRLVPTPNPEELGKVKGRSLCVWCKSLYHSATGARGAKATAQELKTIKSSGICRPCKDRLFAEAAERTDKIPTQPNQGDREAAFRLAEKFHDQAPRVHARKIAIRWPKKTIVHLGPCARIDYVSSKFDGKRRRYFHEFADCELYAAANAQPGGRSLLILTGKFKIKPEGLTG